MERIIPNPKARLLDQVREVMDAVNLALGSVQGIVAWGGDYRQRDRRRKTSL